MKQSQIRMATALVVVMLFGGTAAAQQPASVYNGMLASRYDARALNVYEIDNEFYTPDVARDHVQKALAAFAGRTETDSRKPVVLDNPDGETGSHWRGVSTLHADTHFSFNRRTGRLHINDEGRRDVSHGPPDKALSRPQAMSIAKALIARLHRDKVLNGAEYDLSDIKVVAQKSGFGSTRDGGPAPREWVDNYRLTAKRTIDGVPVVGSFVHVVVQNDGAISELVVANRALKATPRGSVRIDRSADKAKHELEMRLAPDDDTRLYVERWGLAYVDSGRDSQSVLQPAYVFAAVPLTKTPQGEIAGRKLLRVVPVSAEVAQAVAFDPFPPQASDEAPGDPRPTQE